MEIDMEIFLGDILEEVGIMSEVNRDKIESVCVLQEQIAVHNRIILIFIFD